MAKQRISYVPLEKMDAAMREEIDRCAREGTPRPESTAVRAHVPACFWFFANSWNDIFRNGILDHPIKELCRVFVSRSVICEFCGNQRSIRGANEGLKEAHYDDLINFEKSVKYNDRQKAALAYAEAIVWRLDTDDVFWERMVRHFSEPELVELGCAVGLSLGQQSWLRCLWKRDVLPVLERLGRACSKSQWFSCALVQPFWAGTGKDAGAARWRTPQPGCAA